MLPKHFALGAITQEIPIEWRESLSGNGIRLGPHVFGEELPDGDLLIESADGGLSPCKNKVIADAFVQMGASLGWTRPETTSHPGLWQRIGKERKKLDLKLSELPCAASVLKIVREGEVFANCTETSVALHSWDADDGVLRVASGALSYWKGVRGWRKDCDEPVFLEILESIRRPLKTSWHETLSFPEILTIPDKKRYL